MSEIDKRVAKLMACALTGEPAELVSYCLGCDGEPTERAITPPFAEDGTMAAESRLARDDA